MSINEEINKYSKIIWDDQLTKNDKELLRCIVDNSIYEVNDIYKDINLDSDYYLYLAYNASLHGYEGYVDKHVVILKNILRTYSLQKLSKMQSISKVLKCLNENGIKPLLIKGVGLISYYAKDIPRMMSDIDIYINPNQYDKTVELILNIGFEYIEDNGFHIEVSSKELDIDIHRYIYKNHGDINSKIYDRLIPIKFLGYDVYVLSREDMLLHQFVNRGYDISTSNHLKRHLKWIIDCHYIISNNKFSIKKLLDEAEKLNNLYYAHLTISKYAELFPDSFDDKYVFPDDKNYVRWLKIVSKNIHSIKYSMNDKGLKRFIFALQYNYNRAKNVKYIENRKEPLLILILRLNNINTLKEFIRRSKKLIVKC